MCVCVGGGGVAVFSAGFVIWFCVFSSLALSKERDECFPYCILSCMFVSLSIF